MEQEKAFIGVDVGSKGVIALQCGNTKEIYLKVISQGTHYDFYYSLKGEKDWTLLCKDVDASYLSTTTAGGFTGSVIGLYATCK